MSTDNPTNTWPILTMAERRVLGVMVEKAKTTPDVYPMSLNSMMTGSNQKSNRDPVMNLSEENIEDTLAGLQPKGYVTRIQGGRVERWRHNLYDQWAVNKVELAILAELLLRGPQTEGELRQRASRMEPIDDLDELRSALKPLTERRLVLFLGPEGRRGTMITHGFHAPKEVEMLKSQARHRGGDRSGSRAVEQLCKYRACGQTRKRNRRPANANAASAGNFAIY